MRAVCEISGCGKPVVTHGLCNMHRQRFSRHGNPDAGRPDGWGSGVSHPLYERWASMRRTSRLSGGNVPSWDRFWPFVADVGAQPTESHRLYRINKSKPFGPDNFVWRERASDGHITKGDRDTKNAYMRDYNRSRPHILKDKYLKRHYGIGVAEYETLYADQNGTCAICGKPETAADKSGRIFLLAVDHDHSTGAVRGLLCSNHNRGLGLFSDSADQLRAAIAYLECHAPAVDTEVALT